MSKLSNKLLEALALLAMDEQSDLGRAAREWLWMLAADQHRKRRIVRYRERVTYGSPHGLKRATEELERMIRYTPADDPYRQALMRRLVTELARNAGVLR